MKQQPFFFIIGIFFSLMACDSNKHSRTKNNSIESEVDSLLSLMTLEEKIGQMNQYTGFMDFTGPKPDEGQQAKKLTHIKKGLVGSMLNVRGVENVMAVQKIAVEESRLGIPLIIGFDVIHGYKTISPIPLAESASWDLPAIQASARMAAEEASAAGIHWTFAPMVDISRDARWGRVMEGAGEDPFLGSEIAKARVKGFQGKDLTAHNTIAACAKHFAGYGFAEAGKDYNTVDVGTSTLHNIINPPFKAAVEADVKTFMNAFNVLNGIPATGNSFLQRDLLKDQWGFQGFVVSDWDSVGEMVEHGFAEDGRAAAKYAVTAGSDMDMESYHYIEELAQLVVDGEVKEELIDDAVKRILSVKFELGLFDDPYKYCDLEREKEVIGNEEFQKEVFQMAQKSMVLLKNENQLLPLNKSGQKIALIGELAADKTSPLGNWIIAADDDSAISVLEGLQNYEATNEINFERGVKLVNSAPSFAQQLAINQTDKTGIEEAVDLAKKSDVVIMVLGEHGRQSGEGRSRTSLDLPGLQQEMLEAVYAVNPTIVLVLNNGRPLAINWAAKNIPAIVEAWQLGSQAGNAIASVLYGDYNPSGKLPMTFPKNVGQVPLYYNYKSTGRPAPKAENEVFWSGYIDSENAPLYPFGFGLSYTNFEYSNYVVENSYADEQVVKVSVEVKNTGKFKGKETVQLYLQDEFASVTRPVRELKGFQQIELRPNESKIVEFELSQKSLGFYNNKGDWQVEPGNFKVFVGGNAQAKLEKSFTIK
ncbi:beta-glucosidase BglX [Psychroflexus maritimus]|uniref:beta-glucosidase n=1 Tax=Psychroflexus maritimus TaxID=2714865 RepID=A0A967AD12_9FLAO|nr:beta-glucosidase BglX [Psychroflexus maritimus]NGZ90024.1 beta-glucosidase BglX [Psychroflexus maritimus]